MSSLTGYIESSSDEEEGLRRKDILSNLGRRPFKTGEELPLQIPAKKYSHAENKALLIKIMNNEVLTPDEITHSNTKTMKQRIKVANRLKVLEEKKRVIKVEQEKRNAALLLEKEAKEKEERKNNELIEKIKALEPIIQLMTPPIQPEIKHHSLYRRR